MPDNSSKKQHTGKSTDKFTRLYRHYDLDGNLLYVGISLSATHRLSQHSRTSEWFDQISNIDIETYASRQHAIEAEAWAINNENPIHNKYVPECPGSPPSPISTTPINTPVNYVYRPGEIHSMDRMVKRIIDGDHIRFLGWDGDGGADLPSSKTIIYLAGVADKHGVEYVPV